MEPITSIVTITPDTKNWSARVSVTNKSAPRTSAQANPIRFQKILLTDEMGNRVEAMIYRGDVELLQNSLEVDKSYIISNALVRPIKTGFENPLVNNNYQWIIGAKTGIVLTEKKMLVPPLLAPVFTEYNHFHRFLGTRTLISTVALIINCRQPRKVLSRGKESTLHEYVAIDEAFKPFVITFWNDAVTNEVYALLDSTEHKHIIAAMNFTVTDYHGISLSSTSASIVMLHFPSIRSKDMARIKQG